MGIINDATRATIAARYHTLFSEKNCLYQKLSQKGCIKRKGGTTLTETYRVTPNTMISVGDFQAVNYTAHDSQITGSWEPGMVYSNDILSVKQREENMDAGNGKVRDVYKQKINDLQDDFLFRFQEQLWDGDGSTLNGGGGKTIEGVTQAIVASPATGTYAGINRATYAGWRNVVVAGNAGAGTSFIADAPERITRAINNMLRTEKHFNGRPDLFVTDRDTLTQVDAWYFGQNTSVPVEVNGVLSFKGMTMHADDNVGTGLAYLFDSSTWELWHTPYVDMGKKKLVFSFVDRTDLTGYVKGDAAFEARFHGGLRCLYPRGNALITNTNT